MAKRLCALLVSALMAAALLAGCASATATAPAVTAIPTATPETATPSPEVTAPPVAEKKEVTINWSGTSTPDGDAMGLWMMDHFKIKVNMVAIDSADKVKMLAASDALPDLIGGMGIGDPTFMQLKNDGMIRDIPDAMLANYPLTKKTIDEHPLLVPFKAAMSGKNWWLPVYGDADKPKKAGIMPFYYRADWAQKLGVPVPATVDEFYTLLKAFTEKDPDGNGQNDTYGLTGWLWQVHFITWVDMYAWVKSDDGRWVPGFTTPQMLEALKFYNRLYKEKILDPEFSGANGKNMFMQDKVGVMCANSTAWHVWNNIYKGFAGTEHSGKKMTPDEALAAVQFLPPLKATADARPMYAQAQDCWGNAISARTTDEVLDRILEIANWELTGEGRDFLTYGFKDQDWIVKDGKAVSILPNNPSTGAMKKLIEIYPSVGMWGICEGYRAAGTPWLNPPYPQECYDREDQWEAMAAPYVAASNLLIDNISTPAKDRCTYGNAASGACENDFQKLVASPNIDVDWTALMDSYMNAQGLRAAIDEVNAKIVELGLDK